MYRSCEYSIQASPAHEICERKLENYREESSNWNMANVRDNFARHSPCSLDMEKAYL
jgi:hypothetical protein